MTDQQPSLPPAMGDDAFAAVYEANAHRITGPLSVRALDLTGVRPVQHIADIAAGAGALSGPAAERGVRVTAIDVAPGMVRRLAERLRPFDDCEAIQMDGQALALDDTSLDAAFSIFGTIFFPDWRAGLREQARVVKPGGSGCVVTWRDPPGGGPFVVMAQAMAEVLGGSALPPPPDGVVQLADRDCLAEAIRDAGFNRVEVREIEGVWIGRAGADYLADNAPLHRYMPGYADLQPLQSREVDALVARMVAERARDGLVELRSVANVAIGTKG